MSEPAVNSPLPTCPPSLPTHTRWGKERGGDIKYLGFLIGLTDLKGTLVG